MTYTLILMLLVSRGPTMTTIEFPSRAACEAAQATIMESVTSSWIVRPVAVCVAKG